MAIFNGITIPIAIAFAPAWSFENWYTWTDGIFNLFYLIDIGVQFSTSFVSKEGKIVYKRKDIALRYLASGFAIDLLSSIPYSLITPLKPFKVIAILKAIRVFRLGALIDRLQMDEEAKSTLKLGYTVGYLFLIMHLIGCIWYAFVAT